jgi:hypothetical protein
MPNGMEPRIGAIQWVLVAVAANIHRPMGVAAVRIAE